MSHELPTDLTRIAPGRVARLTVSRLQALADAIRSGDAVRTRRATRAVLESAGSAATALAIAAAAIDASNPRVREWLSADTCALPGCGRPIPVGADRRAIYCRRACAVTARRDTWRASKARTRQQGAA